jgi:O-antigen ligase
LADTRLHNPGPPSIPASRATFFLAAALMAASLLLGGSGAVAPLNNLAIELLAIALLAHLAWKDAFRPRSRPELFAFILLALIFAIPLIQLLPLPYALWSALPGRDFAVEVARLTGVDGPWRPISLDPEATWSSAGFLLPPAAMFVAALRLDEADRRRLAIIVVAMAAASLALGALQTAGDGALTLYRTSHEGLPLGLFINRNHQADFLLIGILIGCALSSGIADAGPRTILFGTIVVAGAAGVIATESRTGFLLLPIAILGALTMLPRPRIGRTALAGGAAVAALAAYLVGASAGTGRVLARFQADADARFGYWPDSFHAAMLYWPWGSGLGTFDPVYRAIEDLNLVGPTYANHAHNDYLELLVETGILFLPLLAAFLVLLGRLAFRKGVAEAQSSTRAALLSMLVLLLHSAVDYPLRMIGLLTLFGYLSALAISAARPERHL